MKKVLTLLILLTSISLFSQGEANIWYFGYNAGLDFNSLTPTPLTDGQLSTREGCSSFSDASGNLLFYIGAPNPSAENLTVWNRNHVPMPNGVGLEGDSSSSQSAMIIPKPGSSTEYFIFTVGASSSNNAGFWYYTIDMSLDGGLGNVVGGPQDLTQDRSPADWTEKVAAVKGAECETFWVVSFTDDEFFAYKVSTSGVAAVPVRTTVPFSENNDRGYLKISPDGTKLAIGHMSSNNPAFLLYDFNDVTGVVSNQRRLTLASPNNTPYGIEFSANSKKLYTHATNNQGVDIPANGHTSTLYQFDLSSPALADINASRVSIDNRTLYRGALQLGPDHKIYRALSTTYFQGISSLGVIENPEEDGLACNYVHEAVSLGGRTSSQGLPPFISSIFSQIEILADDGNGNPTVINDEEYLLCNGESLTIEPDVLELPGTTIYNWFKDGILYSNSPDLNFPSVSSADNGMYFLDAEFTDICGNKITLEGEFELTIDEIPVAYTAPNLFLCDDDNNGTMPFDFSQQEAFIENNQGLDTEVFYFRTLIDANSNTNQISSSDELASGTIYARIHIFGNTDCYDISTFEIVVYETAFPLDPDSIDPISTCDNTSAGSDTDGFVVFDLTERTNDILNGQSGFSLTYFTASDYNTSSEISTPTAYTNTVAGGQTIYTRMTNDLESTCYNDTSFEIEVFELPTILSSFIFKNCDEDGTADGITDFNLEEASEFITLGNTSLTVTYHASSNDADNNLNPLSLIFNNGTQSTIYARIQTPEVCYRVSTINLQVSTTSFQDSNFMANLSTCDDDAIIDGLHEFNLSDASAEIINQFPTGQNLTVHYFKTLVDAQLEDNEISQQIPYTSESEYSQTLFVRVESEDNGECFGLGERLTLTVYPRPEFEVDTDVILCLNNLPITLSTYNSQGAYDYTWNKKGDATTIDPTNITEGGIYEVVGSYVGANGDVCESFIQEVNVVESNIATISLDDITIVDDSKNNTITINNNPGNLGPGIYEFALDDGYGGKEFYQDDPFFDNVAPGIRTVYIRDKNGCGETSIEVAVVGFPSFFTPNNDGENDTWQIKGIGSKFFSSITIHIFDRYGKLIAQIDPTGNGWDGYYNGRALPSTDYWFTAQLIDLEGNIRNRKGNFSLIRR